MAKAYHRREQLSDFFHSSRAWLQVCEAFTAQPSAAVVDEKIFCIHGGLSPYLQSLDQINRIPMPLDASGRVLPCDLLWADPTNLSQDKPIKEKLIEGEGSKPTSNIRIDKDSMPPKKEKNCEC